MKLKSLISEYVQEASSPSLKQKFTPLLMRMHSSDRQSIRYWNVRDEDGMLVVELYSSLVGIGMMEFLFEFVGSKGGDMRMFPYKESICIQMKIPSQKL